MTTINNLNYAIIIQQAPNAQDKSSSGVTVVGSMPDTFAFDTAAEYQAPFAQGLFGNGDLANVGRLMGLRLTVQAMTAQIWQGSSETNLTLEMEFQAEADADVEVRQPILALMKMATASIDPTSGFLKAPGPQLDLSRLGSLASSVGNQALSTITGGQAGSSTTSPGGDATPGATVPRPGRLNAQGQTLNASNSANSKASNPQAGRGSAEFWKTQISNQISIQIGSYAYFDSVVITNVSKTYQHTLDANGLPQYARVAIQFKPLFLLVQSDLDNIFAAIASSTSGATSTPSAGPVPAGSAYYKS